MNDFTRDQAIEFLRKSNIQASMPDWLPSRPLLLGYVAAYAAQRDIQLDISEVEPAEGWDYLLDRICERETEIHTGLFKETVRNLLERIGTKARYRLDLTSPISTADIAASFREVFGRDPDDSNLGMLMRLPGLVSADNQSDDRRFVDSDFANVAAAGDIYEFINSHASMSSEPFELCRTNISELAADFLVSKIVRNNRPETIIHIALDSVSQRAQLSCLKGDILIALTASDLVRRDKWTVVSDATIDRLDLRQAPSVFGKIRISDSAVGTLEIDESNRDGISVFQGCVIDLIRGPRSLESLKDFLTNSDVSIFEHHSLTNNSIQELSIPAGLKVGMTALRKLYLQSGGGRQENAFSRGLKPELRKHVDQALDLLVSHGYASRSSRAGSKIYVKNGERISEVHDILNRNLKKNALIDDLSRL